MVFDIRVHDVMVRVIMASDIPPTHFIYTVNELKVAIKLDH